MDDITQIQFRSWLLFFFFTSLQIAFYPEGKHCTVRVVGSIRKKIKMKIWKITVTVYHFLLHIAL